MALDGLEALSFLAGRLELGSYPEAVREQVQIAVKYEGYIERQSAQLAVFDRLESIRLPDEMVYTGISGLSREVVQKLGKYRPANLGQASRVSGITPAAITLLAAHLKARTTSHRKAS